MIGPFTVETNSLDEQYEWSDGGIPEDGIDPPIYDSVGQGVDDNVRMLSPAPFKFRVLDARGDCVLEGQFTPQ